MIMLNSASEESRTVGYPSALSSICQDATNTTSACRGHRVANPLYLSILDGGMCHPSVNLPNLGLFKFVLCMLRFPGVRLLISMYSPIQCMPHHPSRDLADELTLSKSSCRSSCTHDLGVGEKAPNDLVAGIEREDVQIMMSITKITAWDWQ